MSETRLTVVLCDLIASGLVLVEVMLSVEPTDRLYLTVQSECGAEGGEEGGSLEFLCCISRAASSISIDNTHRLAAREGEVEQGNIRIGSLACGGRSACSSGEF